MPQYNDCMNAALAAQVTRIAATQDMLYEYLLLNGGLAGSINDLWNQLWDAAGVTAGAFNDRAFEWLDNLGYTDPDLQTRWFTFWCDGGIISTATNLILNSRMCDNTSDGIPESYSVAETDADVVYAKRTTVNTQWAIFLDANSLSSRAYIAQSVDLGPGEYTAAFTVNEIWPGTRDFAIGSIIGSNVTISLSFPNLRDVVAPTVVHSKFNVSALGSVTFLLGSGLAAETTDAVRYIVSKPQIIAGTTYNPATITGVECTGTPRELFYDSNHEPVKDVNGDYAYVLS